MIFPSSYEFLEKFGIEPVEKDDGIGLYRYIKKGEKTEFEIDISFSVIMRSFQVTLRCSGREISTVSSEGVQSIKIVKDKFGEGLNVVFNINATLSEARVILEPDISFRWWILHNA